MRLRVLAELWLLSNDPRSGPQFVPSLGVCRCVLLTLLSVGISPAPLLAQTANPLANFKDPRYWTNLCTVFSQASPNPVQPTTAPTAPTPDANALNACAQAVALQPRNPDLWQTYAALQLRAQQYPDALASASQALRLRRESSAALLQLCLAAAGMGQATLGLESCDQAIALNKNWTTPASANPTASPNANYLAIAHREKGRILSSLVRSDQPLRAFEESLKFAPTSSLTQAYRCATLVGLGRGEAAIAACEAALKGDNRWTTDLVSESPALALYNLGLAYELQNQPELAIAAYDQATTLDPQHWAAWTQQGAVLTRLQRPTDAIASYARALALRPTHARALVGQCRVLNQLRQYEPALAACQKALQGDNQWSSTKGSNPGAAEAWSQQTHALVGLGRYEEAVAAANRAVGIQPDYPEAWNNRAVALFYLGRVDEAIASTEQSLRIDPSDPLTWSNRGKFLRGIQDYRAAILAYEQALKVAPATGPIPAQIWADRSVLFWSLGQLETALDAANQAIQLDEQNALGWQNRAVILAALKQYQPAAQSYQKAALLNQGNADIWAGWGVVLLQLRQYDQGAVALQQALKLNPNQAIAQQALARLQTWQTQGGPSR